MDLKALRQKLAAARRTFDYRLEKVLFDLAERMCEVMEKDKVSRTELARRMGVSPAYITKILNGNPNLTIKSLLKLSDALRQNVSIQFEPSSKVTQYAAALPESAARAPQEFEVEVESAVECVASRETKVQFAEECYDFTVAA